MNKNNQAPNTSSTALSNETKIPAINTWFNRTKIYQTTVKSPSLVVPDCALSIKTILDRFSRGQSLPKTREPLYSEEDYSQFDRMDKMEKIDLLHETNNYIQQTKQQLQKTVPPKQDNTNKASAPSELVSAGSEQVEQS